MAEPYMNGVLDLKMLREQWRAGKWAFEGPTFGALLDRLEAAERALLDTMGLLGAHGEDDVQRWADWNERHAAAIALARNSQQ